MKSIRSLADLIKETGLNEIEVSEGDMKIRCVRFHEPAVVQVAPQVAAPVAAPAPAI